MSIATGMHVKLATGGQTVVVTGEVGTTVSWKTGDGRSTGSYDESLIRTMQGDNPRYDTPRTKVGLY